MRITEQVRVLARVSGALNHGGAERLVDEAASAASLAEALCAAAMQHIAAEDGAYAHSALLDYVMSDGTVSATTCTGRTAWSVSPDGTLRIRRHGDDGATVLGTWAIGPRGGVVSGPDSAELSGAALVIIRAMGAAVLFPRACAAEAKARVEFCEAELDEATARAAADRSPDANAWARATVARAQLNLAEARLALAQVGRDATAISVASREAEGARAFSRACSNDLRGAQ